MKMMPILIVARKELIDGFRDRRAIYTLLFGTLFGPILVAFMLNQIAGQEKASQEIQIPVVGRNQAPVLVNWLGQQSGVEVIDGPADAEKAVRDRKSDVVVVIKEEFADNFRVSRPAVVQVFSDSTRERTRSKVRRVKALLNQFSATTGSLRLIARGVSPEVVSALRVEEMEISSSQQRAATIFNVIPMFLILAAFTAGMQIATDSTAGERERGSMEPLLLNPVPRWQLVGGKWLAAATAALGGIFATMTVLAFVLSRVSLEDIGVRFHLGASQIVLLLAAVGPMAFIAPALQIYFACFAKSFKEAQSYMSYLLFAIMIPGILSTFYPMTDKPWMEPLPFLGQYAMAGEILGGKVPSPFVILLAAIFAAALAGGFLWLATKAFSDEKIVFGR